MRLGGGGEVFCGVVFLRAARRFCLRGRGILGDFGFSGAFQELVPGFNTIQITKLIYLF